MMEGIIDTANRSLVQAERDFFKDGLLHCGVCGKRKQTRILNSVVVRCNCECDELAYQKKRAMQKAQEDEDRKQRVRSEGIKSQEFRNARFDLDDHANPATEILLRYAKDFCSGGVNYGLLLYGGVGSGKSWGAACIADYLIERGYKVLMINLSDFMNEKDKGAAIDDIAMCDLLILDDFGMERQTEYALEQAFNVIDSRDRAGKPMIVTTNLSPSEIDNPKDVSHARSYSRIRKLCSIRVNFGNRDRRKEIAERKFMEALPVLKGE